MVREGDSTVDPLVIVAYGVHAAVRILAFRDNFCRAVDSTHKRGTLRGENKHLIALDGPLQKGHTSG